MSVEIFVEGDESLQEALELLISQIVENIGEGLMEAADQTFADVVDASQTVWNVRTGRYSGSWEISLVGQNEVAITNDVEYSTPLELGWTTSTGREIASPGVAVPTVMNNLQQITEGLAQWLVNQTIGLLKG